MSRVFVHGVVNGVLNGVIGAITYNVAIAGTQYPITIAVINLVLGMFIIVNTADMIDAQNRRK